MRSILFSILLCATSMVYAAFPGLYLGVEGGYGRADYGSSIKKSFEDLINHNIDEGSLSGRAYAGWNLNRVFAIEGGYTHFADNEYRGTDSGGSLENIDTRTQAVDLVAKGYIPFNDYFEVFAKVGVAYVYSDVEGTFDGFSSIKQKHKRFRATYGLGAILHYNKNIAFTASWLHLNGTGELNLNMGNSVSPSSHLLAIGIMINFNNALD